VKSLHIGRRTTVFVRAILALIVIIGGFGALRANAQNTAAISGSIQDGQKSLIPDASVTATRVETSESFQTVSDRSGFYSFPVLVPGHYKIAVNKAGFAPQVKSGIQIFTGQTSSVNFTLDLGQVQE
jgi:hypothetical protein